MSEDFLLRWSRRKRDAARAQPMPVAPPPAESVEGERLADGAAPAPAGPAPAVGGSAPAPRPAASPAESAAGSQEEAGFDLADLPSLEDIAGDTPVGAFLRHGVPDDLRREALRRAWTTDPVISTFVEMADYDWDFNAPGGNQVFGPLQAGLDVARMAEEIFAGSPRRAPPEPIAPEANAAAGDEDPTHAGNVSVPSIEADAVPPASATVQCCDATSVETALPGTDAVDRLAMIADDPANEPVAMPVDAAEPAARARRHGSALPRWK